MGASVQGPRASDHLSFSHGPGCTPAPHTALPGGVAPAPARISCPPSPSFQLSKFPLAPCDCLPPRPHCDMASRLLLGNGGRWGSAGIGGCEREGTPTLRFFKRVPTLYLPAPSGWVSGEGQPDTEAALASPHLEV